MPDFPIDPELRVRVSPPVVLRRTTEAVAFLRKVALNSTGRAWNDLLQDFETATDEWSATSISMLPPVRLARAMSMARDLWELSVCQKTAS